MKAAAWPPLEPTLRSVTAGFGRRRGRVRVERGDARRAVQRVAVGRAVELDRLADDAGARGATPVSTPGSRWTACPASC